MPKYFVQTSKDKFLCEFKLIETEEGNNIYTFVVSDLDKTIIELQKLDGKWMHPSKKGYNLLWIDQLARQVDSGEYY